MNKRMTLRNEILAKIQAGEKLEHFEVFNQEVNDKLNYYELKKSFEKEKKFESKENNTPLILLLSPLRTFASLVA